MAYKFLHSHSTEASGRGCPTQFTRVAAPTLTKFRLLAHCIPAAFTVFIVVVIAVVVADDAGGRAGN